MDRYEFINIDELLDKDLGELRQDFAYVNPDLTLRKILITNGWLIDSEDNEPDDDYEDDDYSDDEDEEEDYWGDYEEDDDYSTPSDNLTEEEKAIAEQIADDINNDKYSIDTVDDICDMYSQDFIDYLETLIDKEI